MWRIWWASNKASKLQMGFNSAFNVVFYWRNWRTRERSDRKSDLVLHFNFLMYVHQIQNSEFKINNSAFYSQRIFCFCFFNNKQPLFPSTALMDLSVRWKHACSLWGKKAICIRSPIQNFPKCVENEIYAYLCYWSLFCSEFMEWVQHFWHCWKYQWNWLFRITCKTFDNFSYISVKSFKQCPCNCYFIPGNKEKLQAVK
jgi:hypothetical protein